MSASIELLPCSRCIKKKIPVLNCIGQNAESCVTIRFVGLMAKLETKKLQKLKHLDFYARHHIGAGTIDFNDCNKDRPATSSLP